METMSAKHRQHSPFPSVCSIKGNPSVFHSSSPEMMHPYSGAAHTMRQFLQLLFA